MRQHLLTAFAVCALALPATATDIYQPPINYETAPADNAVTRLQKQLATGQKKLTFEDDRGYLKSVLAALDVPESSQVLVFSKTSLQRSRITPKTPRAIYFNDDVYIGFCLRGDVMEVSVADKALGTVFYTLDQQPTDRPRFQRQNDNCMICHASSSNRGLPGHLMRSVHPDRTGEPMVGSGSYRTDDTSEYPDRWGGWYVTGTHGKTSHMGNWLFRTRRDLDEPENPSDNRNLTDLRQHFSTGPYLTPHSDLVALCVFGHQTSIHNKLVHAALETRSARYYETELNKALNEPAGKRWDSALSRIKGAGDELVKAMVFSGEANPGEKLEGTSGFAKEFAARGPFDKRGRSLRQFDLTTRLFKYPCSFLIYSEAFKELPTEVKDYVLRRLYDVLTGKDRDKAFDHLSAADKLAILEILRDTLPDLPGYWKE